MVAPLKVKMDCIISAIEQNASFSMSLNKTKIYKEIVRLLEEIDGRKRTFGFIGNLARGNQGAGSETTVAISKLYKKLTRPKKPKPRPDEVAKRTLVLHATEPELHRIQKKFKPRERTVKLLEGE